MARRTHCRSRRGTLKLVNQHAAIRRRALAWKQRLRALLPRIEWGDMT